MDQLVTRMLRAYTAKGANTAVHHLSRKGPIADISQPRTSVQLNDAEKAQAGSECAMHMALPCSCMCALSSGALLLLMLPYRTGSCCQG
jgi:hypothetical protein